MSSVLNNYDTSYSLLWGTDLANGRGPDVQVDLAPTPHPLQNAVSFLLGLTGDPDLGMAIWNVVALASLVAIGLLLFAIGREWFGWGAGALAAAIFLTREPVLSYGLRAYLDYQYLALLLGALLVEVRRPRAGRPTLVLLMLAGLLRPEAWLFAFFYLVWLHRSGEARLDHLALLAAAPVIWAIQDVAFTGDPMWSLTGTRENVDELGRPTGLDAVFTVAPRRIGEIVREPVLIGAAFGTYGCWRRKLWMPLIVIGIAMLAFTCLAISGLPVIVRYLLAPSALLCLLAAGAVTQHRVLGALTVVAILAFAPKQVDRLENLDRTLTRQDAILADLRDVVRRVEGRPITLPNRRGIPQVRLWTGARVEDVRSAIDDGLAGTYVVPKDTRIAKDFVLDPRDRKKELPDVTVQSRGGVEGKYWIAIAP